MFIKFKKRKLYRNILISFLTLISASIIIVSFILYFNFEKIIIDQTYSNKVSNLMQNGEEVYNMNKSIAKLNILIKQDFNIIALLYNKFPEPADFIPTLKQMDNYKNSNEYVDSIYVYNNLTKTFYSNGNYTDNGVKSKDEFYDTNAVEIIENISKYKVLYPIPRKIIVKDLKTGEKLEKYFYTFVYYDTFSKNPDNIMFINVDQNRIGEFLKKGDNFKSCTFIMDKSGEVVSKNDIYSIAKDISKERFASDILLSDKTSGYFVENVNGMEAFITYAVPNQDMDWIYVSVTPYKDIVSNINRMKINTLIIGVLILVVGLFAAFLISRKLYIPIDKIVDKLDNYEMEREDNLYNLRNDFLKTVVLDSFHHDISFFKNKFREFKVNLDTDKKVKLINLKIDGFSQFIVKYNEEDLMLIQYGITNIIMELGINSYNLQCACMENNEIVILINVKDINESIEEFVRNIQLKIKEVLKISVTLTYSEKDSYIGVVTSLHNKIEEASLNRLIYGCGSIINADKIEILNQKEYEYPNETEKSMITSITYGNFDEAKEHYNHIIEGAKSYSFKEINMSIFHIIFAIDSALHTIKKNRLINVEFNVNSVIDIFKNSENMEEINNAFYKLFENICTAINDKKKDKHKELIDKIIEMINNEYMSQEISIEKIADNFDMNATYIGRLFKMYKQKGINEFINEARISYAKELLRKNKNSIEDISKKCGFTNISYFYKVFKSLNGITPNEYRKTILNSEV